jgi:TonB family protein
VGVLTFTQLQHEKTWRLGLWLSLAAHCLVAFFLMWPVRPIFVTPSSLAFGNHGTDLGVVYLSRQGLERALNASAPNEPTHLPPKIPTAKHRPPRKYVVTRQQGKDTLPSASAQPTLAGSPFGSVLNGALSGHDVRPALPVAWEDPVVPRSTLPPGLEGNVIVEITIDEVGKVVSTKVIQGLGYGIEDKVVAAVRNWRFRPATMDGRAIPSQQDVYYHFPT